MIKVEFSKYVSFNSVEKIIYEFEDDITDEEIQKEFESWVWEDVVDKYCWNKI